MPATPKVLLVDDDPAVRASLVFSLGLDGFEVEAFESAEAMAAKTGDSDASCLIIDYRLPGMDGLALLKLLRNRGVAAPTVIITSNPTRVLRDGAAAAGATVVEKPLLSDTLVAAVRGLIASRQSEIRA